MSGYARRLRASVTSWSSAYISFETGRMREGYRAYAFVEDEDDKTLYQKALTEYNGICFLGCGGKTGVLAIYQRLKSEKKDEGNLFFTDRDTELEPFHDKDAVLRTACYSWESHICDPRFVGWLLQRRLEPNLNPQEALEIIEGWQSTITAFKEILAKHTTLCRTALLLGISLEMSHVVVTKDAVRIETALTPGPAADVWYEAKLKTALRHGATCPDVARRLDRYMRTDPIATSHGKLLFTLLRAYVEMSFVRLERSFRGEYNSAKAWLLAMPWTSPQLDYIRTYALVRIGAA